MDYQLIPDDVYESLPEEPEEKLAFLAKTAQANLNRFISEDSSNYFIEEVRHQFVETMRAVAEALHIEGLPSANDTAEMSTYHEYRYFSTRLSAIITKVKLQSELIPRPYSVKLGRVNKAKVRQKAEQLKVYVQDSDLADKKTLALDKQLDTFLLELERNRLSFSQVAAVSAAVATTFAGVTATIAKAPEAYEAVTAILAAVGEDKEKEEVERVRLSPPPKPLPPPVRAGFGDSADELDDEVPF